MPSANMAAPRPPNLPTKSGRAIVSMNLPSQMLSLTFLPLEKDTGGVLKKKGKGKNKGKGKGKGSSPQPKK